MNRDNIETPRVPVPTKRRTLLYSFIVILWWVGIWGLSETVMSYFVKNSLVSRFAIYTGLLLVVLFAIWSEPDIIEHF